MGVMLLLIISAAAEMSTPDSLMLAKLHSLLSGIEVGTTTNPLGYIMAYAEYGFNWVQVFVNVLLFCPSLYDGWYFIIWMVFWMPIVIGIGYGIVSMLRGAGNA